MTATLTKTLFDSVLNESFRIKEFSPPPELHLIECSPLPSYPGAARPPFRLMFRGAQNAALPQRIYKLENASVGEVEIFLVPVGPDADGMNYEAVFN